MNTCIERRSLAVQIADRIGEEIRAGTWTSELPGKRTLAERYPVKAAVSHFQQWVDGGLKPVGKKNFELELIHGMSMGPPRKSD